MHILAQYNFSKKNSTIFPLIIFQSCEKNKICNEYRKLCKEKLTLMCRIKIYISLIGFIELYVVDRYVCYCPFCICLSKVFGACKNMHEIVLTKNNSHKSPHARAAHTRESKYDNFPLEPEERRWVGTS